MSHQLLLLCATLARESAEPGTPELASLSDLGLQMTIGAVLVGLLALAASRLSSRRVGGSKAAARGALIEQVDVRALGPKRSLHLLRIGGAYVLVGSSEAGFQRLASEELDRAALDERLRASEPEPKPRSGGVAAGLFLRRLISHR